jgi:DNA-binding transcriptional regulator YdaS (Cro superfamily)
MNAITRAIEHFGSQEKLAKALDVSQGAISQYATGNKRPSAEVAIRLEEASGGAIKAEDLRPDVPWHVIRNSANAA